MAIVYYMSKVAVRRSIASKKSKTQIDELSKYLHTDRVAVLASRTELPATHR